MNRENLLLLAKRLDELPANYAHFDMSEYISSDHVFFPEDVTRRVIRTCGTVACAIGHGPSIRGLEARPDEEWEDYCARVFGVHTDSDLWDFLFSDTWEIIDNTPKGAAKRIRYAVEHGVPDDDDAWNPEVYADA